MIIQTMNKPRNSPAVGYVVRKILTKWPVDISDSMTVSELFE